MFGLSSIYIRLAVWVVVAACVLSVFGVVYYKGMEAGKEKIITEYYKNNQQTYGMTEHGYNMMKILVWLLDIKKQKSYKQKQMISNGMTKGMSTTIKIMQGVVNFGQSMQPKSPPITTKKYNQLTKTKNAKRKKKRKVRLGTSGILSDLQKFSKLTN